MKKTLFIALMFILLTPVLALEPKIDLFQDRPTLNWELIPDRDYTPSIDVRSPNSSWIQHNCYAKSGATGCEDCVRRLFASGDMGPDQAIYTYFECGLRRIQQIC
jgi:hypothetical protein